MAEALSRPKFITRRDGSLLHTKIVATIGGRDSYADGLETPGGAMIPPGAAVDVDWLVGELVSRGADVIRVNLSHVKNVRQVGDAFLPVKEAILKREKGNSSPKRIAVLADLPGPKIRFRIEKKIRPRIGRKFNIVLDEAVSRGTRQTVYLDGLPLKTALEKIDRHQRQIVTADDEGLQEQLDNHADRPAERGDEKAWEIATNVLGENIAAAGRGLFENYLFKVNQRLARKEPVFVFVGEAEVVLKVTTATKSQLSCEVVTVKSETIDGNKGFTLKGIDLDIPGFTPTDREYLGELLRLDHDGRDPQVVALVGLSFTQTADDVLRARYFMEKELRKKMSPAKARLLSPAIISKIETNRGWENRHFILDVTDGLMVARGDLGLQVDIERVPDIQKKLIELSNKRGKPVITATQMLSSMTMSIEPTRAEVTDVFNAVQDGTDALMLSEETAKGRFPLHALEKMVKIACKAEDYFEFQGVSNRDLRGELRRRRMLDFMKEDYDRISENKERIEKSRDLIGHRWATPDSPQCRLDAEEISWRRDVYKEKVRRARDQEITNRITESTCIMANARVISAIVTASTSGRTTRMISRLRPRVIIVGATHDVINARKLAVSYGVVAVSIGTMKANDGTDDLFERCEKKMLRHAFLKFLAGKTVIFSGGYPLQRPGTTNTLLIRRLEGGKEKRSTSATGC